MPSLSYFSHSKIFLSAICCAQLYSVNLQATEFELTTLLGQTFSPKLDNGFDFSSLSTSDEPNIALGLSWQDSPNGQGQVLINYISRDFTDSVIQAEHSFDTVYAHFNGVAFFKEKHLITTVGLGIGATYFDSDYDDVLYPSLTISVGTRYEFSDQLSLITELRAYATLTDEDDTLFCQNDICFARFNGGVWFDSQISVGLAYRF
jgi:hypothetical protein